MSGFEIFRDLSGQFRWRLYDDKHVALAASARGYANRIECEHAIEFVRQVAPTAPAADAAREFKRSND